MTKNEAIKLIENMHDVFPSRQEEILDILNQLDLKTEKDKLKIELVDEMMQYNISVVLSYSGYEYFNQQFKQIGEMK